MLKTFKRRIKRNNKKGFTLIELMAVIAILAMLAAILVPSMIGYLSTAKASAANANARTAYEAVTTAAAACISSGDAVDSTSGNVSAFKTGTEFEKKIAVALGDTFEGTISITVDDRDNITKVEWTDGFMTGVYSLEMDSSEE